jgi:hypothetical protein
MARLALPTAVALGASLLGIYACGDEQRPPVGDAPSDIGRSSDGGSTEPEADATPRACDLSGPFANIKVVADLSTPDDDQDVRLTADELTAVISGLDKYGYDRPVAMATRASKSEAFGTPKPVGIAPGSLRAAISPDGLGLLFQAQVYGTGGTTSYDIFSATRASASAAFGNEKAVGSLNSPGLEADPFITASGKSIYFVTSRGGSIDIYSAAAKGDTFGEFEGPSADPLKAVNTGDTENKPTPSSDELKLFYGKRVGTAKDDIWLATRASADAPFAAGSAVPELNSESSDAPTWLSPDGCRLYFISNRPGGPGKSDVYLAERAP